MEKYEKMEIDPKGVHDQIKDNIYKSNKYLKLEILVGDCTENTHPTVDIVINDSEVFDLSVAASVLDTVKKVLLSQNPLVKVSYDFIKEKRIPIYVSTCVHNKEK